MDIQDTFLSPTQLSRFLASHGIQLKKGLGQNFLVDRNVRDKMLSFADLKEDDLVVEIGAGLGTLTGTIAMKVERIVAFEKDPAIAHLLQQRLAGVKNVEIIVGDFIETEKSFFSQFRKKIKIIGNLPYSAVSPILLHLLDLKDFWSTALVTVPEEIATRIMAGSGNRNFGFLAALLKIYTKTTRCFRLPATVFFPRPKVESVLLRIETLETPAVQITNEKLFRKLLPAVFEGKRKTLRNVLSRAFSIDKTMIEGMLKNLGISANLRSHQLTVEQIVLVIDATEKLKMRKEGRDNRQANSTLFNNLI